MAFDISPASRHTLDLKGPSRPPPIKALKKYSVVGPDPDQFSLPELPTSPKTSIVFKGVRFDVPPSPLLPVHSSAVAQGSPLPLRREGRSVNLVSNAALRQGRKWESEDKIPVQVEPSIREFWNPRPDTSSTAVLQSRLFSAHPRKKMGDQSQLFSPPFTPFWAVRSQHPNDD